MALKLADALVQVLRDLGLRYLFGVSGANVEHLHDAVHRIGGTEFISVLAKTEMGAAFMADCRARVHHGLGVCCATSGGGMLNLAVGIAESYSEGVPVLALVGQPPLNLEGRGAFQDSSGLGGTVDSVQFWGSISKYVGKISQAEDFWPMLRAA
ncbi:MAG: thiamine pyrophosphate-binding protein, partial [Polyangiaceae bacterium]